MALDAGVYCDCVEKGLTLVPLPPNATVHTEDDGCPRILLGDREEVYTDWDDFPCEHKIRRLVYHRLGNIALVGLLRAELARDQEAFPLLLKKVLYNGSHCGDWLPLNLISELRMELEKLKTFRCHGNMPEALLPRLLWKWFHLGRYHYTSASECDDFMQAFRQQMVELADAATRMNKPIAF